MAVEVCIQYFFYFHHKECIVYPTVREQFCVGGRIEDLKHFHSNFNLVPGGDQATQQQHTSAGSKMLVPETAPVGAPTTGEAQKTQASSFPAEGALHTPPKEKANQPQPHPAPSTAHPQASPNKLLQASSTTRLDDSFVVPPETVAALATQRQAEAAASQATISNNGGRNQQHEGAAEVYMPVSDSSE